MSWIPDQADREAAALVRLWASEGMTPREMIEAVGGKVPPKPGHDDAHHAIAAAVASLWGIHRVEPSPAEVIPLRPTRRRVAPGYS